MYIAVPGAEPPALINTYNSSSLSGHFTMVPALINTYNSSSLSGHFTMVAVHWPTSWINQVPPPHRTHLLWSARQIFNQAVDFYRIQGAQVKWTWHTGTGGREKDEWRRVFINIFILERKTSREWHHPSAWETSNWPNGSCLLVWWTNRQYTPFDNGQIFDF